MAQAWIDLAGVTLSEKEQMLFGLAAVWRDHCIEKKSARVED